MRGKGNHPDVFFKKVFLRNYEDSKENTCVGIAFLIFKQLVFAGNKRCYVLKKTLQLKETPTQVFNFEFC